jgi:hypothetical protein
MQVPQWVKPGVWGAIIGTVAIMISGFSWWGWTLGSTAEQMATERANKAVVAFLTPICVESFMKQPDATARLAEFQQTAAWKQPEFVEKGGWATAPGNSTSPSVVARACAEQLVKIKS